MRLLLIGQAAFGRDVLVGLCTAGHDIAAVYAPPQRAGKPDPLAAGALELGIPLRTPPGYRDPSVAQECESLGADLGLLAFVTKIIPPAVIEAPRLGTLCFHPSILPRYRGGSALAWQIIRGETRGGFTIFWTDPGIDTGPILLQREVEIDPEDTAGSLYFDKIFSPGVAAMVEAVALVAAGTAPRIAQDESRASYDPLCGDAHAAVHWEQPCSVVHDLIRGCDPQPGAHATWRGERLRLYDARRRPEALPPGSEPGTIVALDRDGLHVAVGRGATAGTLAIGRLRGAAGKAKAQEIAPAIGLAVGDRLGPGQA